MLKVPNGGVHGKRGFVQLDHWIPYWNSSMAIWHYLDARALCCASSLLPFSSLCPFLRL